MFNFLEKNKKYLVYTPLVLYWVVLLISTSLPLESVPSVGLSDKFLHTVAYAGLAVLLYPALLFQKKYERFYKSPVLYTFIIGMIYAAFDELHQLLVPGRKCDIVDVAADGVGILIGLLLIVLIRRIDSVKAVK